MGTVRAWNDEEGWGVIDSSQTPGGCWTHFSSVLVAGYRSLRPGQEVELDWERADQDGYEYRATRAWPRGTEPVAPVVEHGSTGAYSSRLTTTFGSDSE